MLVKTYFDNKNKVYENYYTWLGLVKVSLEFIKIILKFKMIN